MMTTNKITKIEYLKDEIYALELERNKLETRLNLVSRELIQLQSECDHINELGESTLKYNSTDIKNDYYKCTICNAFIKK